MKPVTEEQVRKKMTDDQKCFYEERAAILEYVGRLPRTEAEARALWEVMGYRKQESLW
jgi:hypothetical protein